MRSVAIGMYSVVGYRMRLRTWKRLVGSAMCLIAVGCGPDTAPRPLTTPSDGPTLVLAQPCPSDSAVFFPRPSALPDADDFERHLRVFGEGPLCTTTGSGESYRILFLPSFLGSGVARVESRGDSAWVIGRRGADPVNKVAMGAQRRRAISAVEWVRFNALLDSLNFWTQAAEEPMKPGMGRVDGDTWMLEGVRAGAYHAMSRWFPGETETHARLARIGEFMLAFVAR